LYENGMVTKQIGCSIVGKGKCLRSRRSKEKSVALIKSLIYG